MKMELNGEFRITDLINNNISHFMIILLFFVVHWYLSLFTQTFFLHRYVSHGMFKMNIYWEKFFFFLTFIVQGSSFLNPAAYGIMHREHHAHSDKDGDPHSPISFKSPVKFMLETFHFYSKTILRTKDLKLNNKGLPQWALIENLGESMIVRISFVAMYTLFYFKYSTSYWQYLLIPMHILMGPIHGFIVNWFGHKTGYRNHDELNDNSKNSLPVDILMMGELYQNNHHKKPNSPNFAQRWFEIDFGYLTYLFLKRVKVIY